MTAVVIIYALYIALLFLGKMYVDHIKFQNCPCQHFDQITLLRRGGLSEKEISEHYRNFFSEAAMYGCSKILCQQSYQPNRHIYS